jgi:hypothetical protein
MNETMTLAEMYEKYPNHWLLIADPVSVPPEGLQSGRVIFASEDRDERDAFMCAQDPRSWPKRTATICTAKRPAGTVMIL